MPPAKTKIPLVAAAFRCCVEAIRAGSLIERVSRDDKEFHFQNWFRERLVALELEFDAPGRNSYPDFRMVQTPEGFELKGLAYPGRHASFDSNSQVPTGHHNGRDIFYVFGRYPQKPDGDSYPVLDIVICHGDFLNADSEYVHKNKSIKGFGTYGDIMIRDRKMYVLPTPYYLVRGAAHRRTLILPKAVNPGIGFVQAGQLERCEADELIVSYAFDLRTNEMLTEKIPNPRAGHTHRFTAWRLDGDPLDPVSMEAHDGLSTATDDAE